MSAYFCHKMLSSSEAQERIQDLRDAVKDAKAAGRVDCLFVFFFFFFNF